MTEASAQGRRIVVFLGHPSPDDSYCRALAYAYADAAMKEGHTVELLDGAAIAFPFLRDGKDFQEGEVPPSVAPVQQAIGAADHLVLVFPMWLGTLPAYTKGLLEQVFRPSFAFDSSDPKGLPKGLMKGKSARIIMTMGMPAVFYRIYFRAHGLKNLERNMLRFCGFDPVRTTLIGSVEQGDGHRKRWLARVSKLGAAGA